MAKQKKISVNFFPRKSAKKDKYKVYCRINYNAKSTMFSLEQSINATSKEDAVKKIDSMYQRIEGKHGSPILIKTLVRSEIAVLGNNFILTDFSKRTNFYFASISNFLIKNLISDISLFLEDKLIYKDYVSIFSNIFDKNNAIIRYVYEDMILFIFQKIKDMNDECFSLLEEKYIDKILSVSVVKKYLDDFYTGKLPPNMVNSNVYLGNIYWVLDKSIFSYLSINKDTSNKNHSLINGFRLYLNQDDNIENINKNIDDMFGQIFEYKSISMPKTEKIIEIIDSIYEENLVKIGLKSIYKKKNLVLMRAVMNQVFEETGKL